MIEEITKFNGDLDPKKFASKMNSLVSQLIDLETQAKETDTIPTTNSSGALFWKSEKVNPEKIEQIGKNAYLQAILTKEIMDTQIQAMQISIGSYDAMKVINEELTEVIDEGFRNSAEDNSFLFDKTKEQIRRVADFAKKNADNLKQIEKQYEEKLVQFKNDESKKLSEFANKKDVESIKNESSNIKREIKDIKNFETESIEKISQLEDQIKLLEKALTANSDRTNYETLHNIIKDHEQNVYDMKNEITTLMSQVTEKITSTRKKNTILMILCFTCSIVGIILSFVF